MTHPRRKDVDTPTQQRVQFAKLVTEAKLLEKEINRLVASFEEKNNLTCYTIPSTRNSIELVISTDIDQL